MFHIVVDARDVSRYRMQKNLDRMKDDQCLEVLFDKLKREKGQNA